MYEGKYVTQKLNTREASSRALQKSEKSLSNSHIDYSFCVVINYR